jgi:hypothetical protein
VLATAERLTSELVTNGVVHGPKPNDAGVEVYVEIETDLLRVEVADTAVTQPAPRKAGEEGVNTLASRWGSDCDGGQYVTWFELDLPRPGTRR